MTIFTPVYETYTQSLINECAQHFANCNSTQYNPALEKVIDYLYDCSNRGTLPPFMGCNSVDFVYVTPCGEQYGVTDTQAGALTQIYKEFNKKYCIGQLFKVSNKNCNNYYL